MTHASRSRSTLHRALAAMLALWLVLTALPPTGTLAAQPLPDLAALVLLPTDLDADGLAGHGVGEGRTFTTLDEVMTADPYAYSHGAIALKDVPGAVDTLRDSGWTRFHELQLPSPDPAQADLYRTLVASGIEEYATPDGAAAALDALTTQQALEDGITGQIQIVPATTPLGDQSALWRNTSTATDTAAPVQAFTAMVRTGSRIVSVSMVDFTGSTAPDQARVERLVATLLARVQAAQDVAARPPCLPSASGARSLHDDRGTTVAGVRVPGMSPCTQRLADPRATPGRARYVVIDGVVQPAWDASPEQNAAAQTDANESGLRDSYEMQYVIDDAGTRAFYYVLIDRYVDADTATFRFDGLEARLRSEPEVITLSSFEPGTPTVGDASATYSWTTPSTSLAVTSSATRIDTTIVTVRISQTDTPIPAITQSLLLAQIACMQAGACNQPVPVPPEVMPAMPV